MGLLSLLRFAVRWWGVFFCGGCLQHAVGSSLEGMYALRFLSLKPDFRPRGSRTGSREKLVWGEDRRVETAYVVLSRFVVVLGCCLYSIFAGAAAATRQERKNSPRGGEGPAGI